MQDNKERILNLIKKNKNITPLDIAQKLNLELKAVIVLLDELLAEHRIARKK